MGLSETSEDQPPGNPSLLEPHGASRTISCSAKHGDRVPFLQMVELPVTGAMSGGSASPAGSTPKRRAGRTTWLAGVPSNVPTAFPLHPDTDTQTHHQEGWTLCLLWNESRSDTLGLPSPKRPISKTVEQSGSPQTRHIVF
jgi:hypothetical protein